MHNESILPFPKRREKSVLYKVVSENLNTFLELGFVNGGVPEYVEKEFNEFLECGVLAYGFLRVKCDDCKNEKLVPFSCKKRGFCPTCTSKRMSETTEHIESDLIPRVPLRQFVLSVPIPLRFWMSCEPKLQSKIHGIVCRVINGFYKRKLSERYSLNKSEIELGGVTLIQRSGSRINLNIHFHMLYVDGCYVMKNEKPVFYKAPEPSDSDIETLIKEISHRVIRYLRKRGYLDSPDIDESLINMLYSASIKNVAAFGINRGRRLRFIGSGFGFENEEISKVSHLCVKLNGFSLHAASAMRAGDRKRIRNICNYVLRPPVAVERLKELDNGDISYRLKKPWSNGTTHVVFTPLELMERLAAIIPKPRTHPSRWLGSSL